MQREREFEVFFETSQTNPYQSVQTFATDKAHAKELAYDILENEELYDMSLVVFTRILRC